MSWKVEFYDNKVMASIKKWPENMQAKFTWILELIKENGPSKIGMPYIKTLGGGLLEIRVKCNEGIARAIFCIVEGKLIIILNEFIKKTQKTPSRELEIARQRFKEVKKNG